MILFDSANRFFHIKTSEMSYAFGISDERMLRHMYYGPLLQSDGSLIPLAEERLQEDISLKGVNDGRWGSDEIPTRERGDYGDPVVWVQHTDGVRGLCLRYEKHTIDGDHLTVYTKDETYPVTVEVHYKTWGDLSLLSRWLVIHNDGETALFIEQAKSAAWQFPKGLDYRLTHLSGNWGCEYTRNQSTLTQARTVLQNTRVTCAAAQQIPFFALDPNGQSTETYGPVYFGVLHWSGDFDITIEQQFGKCVTVTGGINSFDCTCVLKENESFETPMFTGGFSSAGFEHMSEILYDWQYDYLIPRGNKIDKAHDVRPIIYNSWYPYEFGVNEKNCLSMIDICADIGAELFVIDDGWMQGRINDKAGLGDWTADRDRFPNGLQSVAKACRDRNMLFGLWVEPEMVNPDSDLYRSHPEWVIQIPTRQATLQRNQLILNLARDDVRDWAIKWLDELIDSCQLDYLKWDMNRYVTENGWPDASIDEQKSLPIRYIQNLYVIWKHLNEHHPDVLFENCASGGGRSDFGMVPFADRINRSDNADPVDVMVLHEGFTMLFIPKTAGGAGNIAPARHHIHNRQTPLKFRLDWGMTGSMSIGINLLTVSDDEKKELQDAITRFKQIRGDLQDAYVYRIASATEHPYALFQYVRRDRKSFTLFSFAHGMRCWDLPMPRFRMRGLIPYAKYVCEDGRCMTGEALMNIGVAIRLKGDCDSRVDVWHIKDM